MKNKHDHKSDDRSLNGGIGKELQEGSKRKHLSYLNELPQLGGYEAKAGEQSRKQKQSMPKKDNSMADES